MKPSCMKRLERIRLRFLRIEVRVDHIRERFIKRFKRPPGPLDSSFIKAMAKAGVDAAWIYGFWKTGILITTPYGSDRLSANQLEIWDAAICEYLELTQDGFEDSATDVIGRHVT